MQKLLSRLFHWLGFCAAGVTLIAVPWYVFGDLPNPLPLEFLSEFGVAAPIFRWPFGLMSYVVLGTAMILICRACSRIALVGWTHFLEEVREQSAREKRDSIREAGTLIAVSVDSGGLLDSATSMIETTDGFYRVFGRVDVAAKGEKVTIQRDFHSIFKLEWLCLGGKRFQMTK